MRFAPEDGGEHATISAGLLKGATAPERALHAEGAEWSLDQEVDYALECLD